MNTNDIIFATTIKTRPGFCKVTYYDGNTDTISHRIGQLFNELNQESTRGRYFMIGRSDLICENNIIKINPAERELIMALDSLSKPHIKMEFSDDILRNLRSEMNQ